MQYTYVTGETLLYYGCSLVRDGQIIVIDNVR